MKNAEEIKRLTSQLIREFKKSSYSVNMARMEKIEELKREY